LLITPADQRYWRLKYRHLGKEKLLALGVYPTVSLAAARKKRDAAREKLEAGTDPSEAKKVENRAAKLAAANSFEAVARAWMVEHQPSVSASTYDHTIAWMENDVFLWLGRRPITEIDAPEILAVIKRIDRRGARHTAHKVRSKIGMVFRYGIRQGHCESDPARDLIGAIPQPQVTHMASITEPTRVGEILRAFEAFTGTFPVQCALKARPHAVCPSWRAAHGGMDAYRPGQSRVALYRIQDKYGSFGGDEPDVE
jgi:hypothetical protein